MRFCLLALVLPLCSSACTSVEIVPNDGGNPPLGAGPSSGGFDADGGGGAGVIGGGPTAGSPEPGPVPGCEALVLAGEPVLLANEAPPLDTHPSLAVLESGQVGLVYLNGWAGGAELRSRTMDGAFEVWPPTVSAIALQHEGMIAAHVAIATFLPNGMFTLTSGVRGIYSFGAPGPVRQDDDWVQTFLEPGAGTPFDVVTYAPSASSDYRLEAYGSLDAAAPTSSFDLPATICNTMRMATGETGSLFSIASDYYCDGPPRVDFIRKSNSGIELTGGMELPAVPVQQSLAARPGGYWYFMSSPVEGVGSYAYALDENGALVAEPWHDPFTYGSFSPQFLPWRDGFIGTHRDNGEVSLFASDGFNRTDSLPVPDIGMAVIAADSPLAMAVGGDDSGSILVAYPIFDGILLARFDCVTPFK